MTKKFKDTNFAKFLSKATSKGLNVVEVATMASNGDIIGAIDKAKDIFKKSNSQQGDDLLRELEKNKTYYIEEIELYLKDVDSARTNETKRDISENSSWLSKNIHEIIALQFVVGWFVMICILFNLFLKKSINLNELVTLLAATGIKDMVLLILGYLYGRTKPQK